MAVILSATIAFLVLSTNIVQAGTGGENIDFSGSFEVRAIGQERNNDYLLEPYKIPGLPVLADIDPLGTSLNFRGDLSFKPAEQVAVKLRLGYQSDTTLQVPAPNEVFTLNRGYIDFTPNSLLSLRIGKQRLAWGTGYAWNPTDILDLPRAAFTAADDPEGVVAFRGDLSLGVVTSQVFLVPSEETGSDWEKSGRAVRFKASPFGVDLTTGWVKPGTGPAAVIGDFAYSLSGIGLHGEVLYQAEGNWRADKDRKDVVNYLIGADYNFPGGYYLAVEYYHNDTGFKDVPEMVKYLALPGFKADLAQLSTSGATRDHVFLRGMKTFGEKFTGELVAIYNPVDGSVEAQPKLEYAWGQNTTLFSQGLLIRGQGQVEANLLPLKDRLDVGMKVSF